MRSRRLLPHLLLALTLGAAVPVFSQVVPAATGGQGLPISIGAGISSFNPDFDNGRMLAGVLWIDFIPPLPTRLHGLGLEVEGDDIAFDPNKAQARIREQVASGGATYAIRSFRGVRPYAKYLMGFGNVDYPIRTGSYHQTRTVTTCGGGASFRVLPGVSVRAEYEYQFWPDFWITSEKNLKDAGSLNPNGITVGASYQFSSLHLRF